MRREQVLDAAIPVFGRYGFKKTSLEDLAAAAKISKQGLYLHFSGKDQLFIEAMRKYLEDGLALAQSALESPGAPLAERLLGALDAWFGRHLATFHPQSFDVIEAGEHLAAHQIEKYKSAFQAKLTKALADSPEFKKAKNVCSAREVAQVLFVCGLTWKEGQASRAEFLKKMAVCVRACCQIET